MERVCGCGSRFKCLKTGLTMRDTLYGTDALQQADMYGCLKCGSIFFITAEPYFYDDAFVTFNVLLTDDTAFYAPNFLDELVRINSHDTMDIFFKRGQLCIL